MAKTYNTFTNVATGDVYTAASHNAILTNLAGYRVPPMCILTASSVQTISNTTATALTYSSEVLDTDDMHSTSSQTDRITINTAGVYVVTASLEWAGQGADGSRVLMTILKNGTELCRTDTGNYSASSALGFCLAVTTACVVTDYLQFNVYQSSGGTRNVNASHFAATWQGQVS